MQQNRSLNYGVQDLITAISEGITQEEVVDLYPKVPIRFTLWPLTHQQRGELERDEMKIGQKLMGDGFNEMMAQALQQGDDETVRKAMELMAEKRRTVDMSELHEIGDGKIAKAVAYSIKRIEFLWTEKDLKRTIGDLEDAIEAEKSKKMREELEEMHKELMEKEAGDVKRDIDFTRTSPCPIPVVQNLPPQLPNALYYHVQKLNAFDLTEDQEKELLDVVAKFRPERVGDSPEETARAGVPPRAVVPEPDVGAEPDPGSD